MQSDVSVMYARLDLIEEVTGERVAPTTLDELEQLATEINNPPQLLRHRPDRRAHAGRPRPDRADDPQ